MSPTRSDLEGAALPVHGEVLQVHDAVGADGESLGVEHAPVGEQSADSSLVSVVTSASKKSIRRFVITEKAPTRAFSWLKAATTAFTFKTLLRHYAKRALTPRSLNVKLGPRHKSHKGRVVWLA